MRSTRPAHPFPSVLQAQSQRAEALRLRRDELAEEVEEAAAAVAHEEAEQAELRRQVQVRQTVHLFSGICWLVLRRMGLVC